jgi:hypothetical protein
MAAWPHGRMAAWPHGRMAAWPHGRMAAWPHGRNRRSNIKLTNGTIIFITTEQ